MALSNYGQRLVHGWNLPSREQKPLASEAQLFGEPSTSSIREETLRRHVELSEKASGVKTFHIGKRKGVRDSFQSSLVDHREAGPLNLSQEPRTRSRHSGDPIGSAAIEADSQRLRLDFGLRRLDVIAPARRGGPGSKGE